MLIDALENILKLIAIEMNKKNTTTRNIMDPWVYTIKNKKNNDF